MNGNNKGKRGKNQKTRIMKKSKKIWKKKNNNNEKIILKKKNSEKFRDKIRKNQGKFGKKN